MQHGKTIQMEIFTNLADSWADIRKFGVHIHARVLDDELNEILFDSSVHRIQFSSIISHLFVPFDWILDRCTPSKNSES